LLAQELSKKVYDGQLSKKKDSSFIRDYDIDLNEAFETERESMAKFHMNCDNDSDIYAAISPTAFGKTFMVHYAI
jgi:hypothetical protein